MTRHEALRCCAIILAGLMSAGCNGGTGAERVIRALQSGNSDAAEAAMDEEDVNINSSNHQGVTPLLQALISNNRQIYSQLLKKGADPNLCDRQGRCVMNEAAKRTDPSWLEEAVAHGGNPDALNSGNHSFPSNTPLFYALHKDSANPGPRAKTVRVLIEAGADVNHRDGYGRTPLREAAEAGNYESVVDLLKAGADPRIGDSHGFTLLDWFDGRDETLVPSADQVQWFRKAADFLIEKGLLARDGKGNLSKGDGQSLQSKSERATRG